MLNLTNFQIVTKLKSCFAVATILNDSGSDSDGGTISEVIDLANNTIFFIRASIFHTFLYI